MTGSHHPRTEAGARPAALRILEAIGRGRGRSNELLAALPFEMEERDRALCTTLVYGVLRQRNALDQAIGRASKRPLPQIDEPLLEILRLAAFQILFLSRIPRSAAVDEAVSLSKRRLGKPEAAFANGVLRSLCRSIGGKRRAAPRPDLASDPEAFARWLEIDCSCPRFLVDRFLARYGASEGEALLRAQNLPAPVVLRPARRIGGASALAAALEQEGIGTRPSPWLSECLRVVRGAPQRTRLFRDGAFYIQDEAAQIVSLLMEPIGRADSVIDLCAAPGGKILQALDRAQSPEGTWVAADRSRGRMRTLRQNATRAGLASLSYVVMDAEHPCFAHTFDRVMLDAPCSGSGVIRRHPEIRWRRAETDLRECAERQRLALDAAQGLLAPGGRLIYAVCSLEPEEGAWQIDGALRRHPELRIVDAAGLLPEALRPLVNARGMLETLPHRDDLDGFFAAVLTLC